MLRYNPLLNTWTMVAANRQHRPNMPKDYCPFCPGSGKVPDQYDVLLYPNDFPALSTHPQPAAQTPAHSTFVEAPAYGICEVILYASQHHANLYNLSDQHLLKLINLWSTRFATHQTDPRIKYIFPFENRGEAVGVTMPHPHGQLYAYPFVPLKIRTELDNCRRYYQQTGNNLFADMLAQELADGRRIIFQNQYFTAYIPYFTDYPYGVFVVPNFHCLDITQLTPPQQLALAHTLRHITGGYDALFGTQYPYMMCFHQQPVNEPYYADCDQYFRFHIEFYAVWRAPGVVKYYASSETGAWAAANTRLAEDTAPELRAAIQRFNEQYQEML